MPRQLFGTDGVRGVAGEYPLDARTVHALGLALGDIAARLASVPEVVIGMDTRESGPWLADQVAGGLLEKGVRVRLAGITTTPGIAYLTRSGPYAAGVMISASHNPYRDNGIKIFSHSGYKLPDQQEHDIETEMFAFLEQGVEARPGALSVDAALDQLYIDYLASTAQGSLEGMDVVLDCGNGAASRLGPELFQRLGARVHAIHCEPNGRNINLNCGALHVETLQKTVVERKAHLGVAFDGDADRAIFASPSGRVVNGDAVLLIAGRSLHARGRLPGDTVVATVMSNLGLERALGCHGIRMLRTPVGDKYVLEEMMRCGAVLGGEQSGHVIFLEYATTGDGLLTALRVMEMVRESGQDLDALSAELQVFPQLLVNVRVQEKRPLDQLESVKREIREAEEAFGDAGRVLVRFSGTEPLVRVMVEGEDAALVQLHAQRIADTIRQELGAA